MITILLLEDDLSESTKFLEAYATELVSITPVVSVAEAFHQLSNDNFDLCIIDPVMSQTLDFNKLLEELSNKDIELKIVHPGKFFPEFFKKTAQKFNVDVIPLQNQQAILEVIRELVKKKSSGSTLRITTEQQQQAIKQVKLEVLVERLDKAFHHHTESLEKLKDRFDTQQQDFIEIKNNQSIITSILTDLKQDVGKLKQYDPGLALTLKKEEESTKRFGIIVGVVTTLLTVLGLAAPTILPFVSGLFSDKPPPQIIKKK